MRTARFKVYQARDGWRWRLIAANNRQVAQGEAHTRERDAWRAANQVAALAYAIEVKRGRPIFYFHQDDTDLNGFKGMQAL